MSYYDRMLPSFLIIELKFTEFYETDKICSYSEMAHGHLLCKDGPLVFDYGTY